MHHGFHLYIDEAGDEGIERVRPYDPDGAPEYFVMAGVLIQPHRRAELAAAVDKAKQLVGIEAHKALHFRDLDDIQKASLVEELAKFRAGLFVVVSNKRNMRGYRNRRVEAKNLEVVKGGRLRPQNYNWFYNNVFRYLLERVSVECARWSPQLYGEDKPIRVVFSHRRHFRYSQTQAYLHKLKIERHGKGYFNNKRQVDWRVVDPSSIEEMRASREPALQFADCIASAVYRAIDEDWFGTAAPGYLSALAPRFMRANGTPFNHGFTLLPEGFKGPLSNEQRRGLRAVGWRP